MMAHPGPLSANLKSKLFIGFLLSAGGSPVAVGPWLPLPSTAIFEAIAWVVPVGKEYEAGLGPMKACQYSLPLERCSHGHCERK